MEVRDLRKKEDKTDVEWTLLSYSYMLSLISEVCIDVSKCHLTGDEGVEKIRQHLMDNWH